MLQGVSTGRHGQAINYHEGAQLNACTLTDVIRTHFNYAVRTEQSSVNSTEPAPRYSQVAARQRRRFARLSAPAPKTRQFCTTFKHMPAWSISLSSLIQFYTLYIITTSVLFNSISFIDNIPKALL